MKSTNQSRLASRTGGVWKNESLNESFGSHWANKVKTNAYYKNMKVFFELECMSTCCWGLPKPKYEPFITHNRGTLNPGFWFDAPFMSICILKRDWSIFYCIYLTSTATSKAAEPSLRHDYFVASTALSFRKCRSSFNDVKPVLKSLLWWITKTWAIYLQTSLYKYCVWHPGALLSGFSALYYSCVSVSRDPADLWLCL